MEAIKIKNDLGEHIFDLTGILGLIGGITARFEPDYPHELNQEEMLAALALIEQQLSRTIKDLKKIAE